MNVSVINLHQKEFRCGKIIKYKFLYFNYNFMHVARMEEGRSAFKILTGKPTGKRPLGRPRRRWEDNIRMDLEKMCQCGELG